MQLVKAENKLNAIAIYAQYGRSEDSQLKLSFAALWESKQPEALLGNRLPMLYKQIFKQIMKLCQYLLGCCLEANQIFSDLMVSLWKEVAPVVQFGNG